MDDDPKPRRRWGGNVYIVLIVIAALLAVFVLRPLLQGATNPFQAITSALGGQQR